MRYRDFLEAHKLFEAKFGSFIYNLAFKAVSMAEGVEEKVFPILVFLLCWNKQWYLETLRRLEPLIEDLREVKLWKAELTPELGRKIQTVFEEVAKVCGYTGASKALHLLAPNLFVMWDDRIRKEGYGLESHQYVDFIRLMRNGLLEMLREYASEKNLDSLDEAEERLTSECGNKPLTKILDEYNYLTFSRREIPTPKGKDFQKARRIMEVIEEIVAGALEAANEAWIRKEGLDAMIRSSANKLLKVMRSYAEKGDYKEMFNYYVNALSDPTGRKVDQILRSLGKKTLTTEYSKIKTILNEP